MLNIVAPAKINLVLEVLGKRNDGYHEICSVMQTVSFCDSLSFELADEIRFQCNEPSLRNNDNLVIQAVESLQKVCGLKKGARIELEKRIPWSAGLGGGSSDAAITLRALNELWDLKLPFSELLAIAAQVGSDVPFFLHQGTALVEGRGEKVKSISQLASCWFVLFIPPVTYPLQKTKTLFSRLGSANFTDGRCVQNILRSLSSECNLVNTSLYNVFDAIAFHAFPGLEKYWELFVQAGAGDVHLTGSGPGLYALAPSESKATEWSRNLKAQGLETYVVSTFESQVA
jgi:4-diphosphocytidyl-2-C-methyl-D-erythritol kinase